MGGNEITGQMRREWKRGGDAHLDLGGGDLGIEDRFVLSLLLLDELLELGGGKGSLGGDAVRRWRYSKLSSVWSDLAR